jgi:hypothetical protein
MKNDLASTQKEEKLLKKSPEQEQFIFDEIKTNFSIF